MSEDLAERISLRRYLLGEISDEAELRRIEERLLGDDDFQEELAMAEEELIDRYVFDELSPDESMRFREHFLCHPEREARLELAQRLKVYATEHRRPEQAKPRTEITSSPRAVPWFRTIPASLKIAASVLLAIGLGLLIWKVAFRRSDVERSLVALNAAYREQRPVEARISQLNYAPYLTTRGPGDEKIDQNQLRLAELTLLEASTKNPTPPVHHALGKVYLAKKQFDDAIENFDKALKGDPRNAQIYSDLGAAWLEKGKLDLEGKEPGKGMEELGRSLENLTKALELNPNLLEARFNRALCRHELKLSQQAEDDWREYLKRDSTSPWATDARRNLQNIEEEKNKKAHTNQQLLKDFLAAYATQDDDAAWAALSVSRGRSGSVVIQTMVDDYLNDSTSAAADKLRAISYAGRIEQERVQDRFTLDLVTFYLANKAPNRDSISRARALLRRANQSYMKGQFGEAGDLYAQAHTLFTEAGDECESLLAESWIGYCYLRIPRSRESIRIFERLARVFEIKRYRSLFALSLSALADAESSLNEFTKSLDYSGKGLKEATQIEDYATGVRCLGQAVSMQLALGNYHESLKAYIEAVALAEKLPDDPTLIWQLYFQSAFDFLLIGQSISAVAFDCEALRLANMSGIALLKSRSLERLGILYSKQNDFEQAIWNGQQALAEGQRIADERAKKAVISHSMLTLGEISRQGGNPQQAIGYYTQSLDIYKALDFDAYVYEAHKGKLLAFITLNNETEATSELATVLNLYEQFRQKIADESNRDRFFDTGQDTYELAIDFAYCRKNDPNKALEYAEASRARSLFEIMNTGARVVQGSQGLDLRLASDTTPLAVPQIQERLPREAQVLEYAVLDREILIWVVNKSRISSASVNLTAGELNETVHDYLDAIAGRDGQNHQRVLAKAQALYLKLIEPISKELDPQLQLCIVPDRVLNFLPFSTLRSPAGRYLFEDFRMEVSPSATVFVAASEAATKRRRIDRERLLAVGNPRFDRDEFGSLPDLPEAVKEVGGVASFYKPSATILIEDQASPSRVRQALDQAEVIHLATHVISDQAVPLLSKFILAASAGRSGQSGGGLQASEIYNLKLNHARVVVLSACQTGVAQAYRGEGAIGLARPFIAAGAPVVIASLWAVESKSTTDLMINFHRHRKIDLVSSVEALRRAQLDMLYHPGSPEDNYDWAAFIAIGGYATF